MTQEPESLAMRCSMPVPTLGASGKSRGTAFNIEEMQKLGKRVYIHQQDNKNRNPHNGVFWLIGVSLLAVLFDKNKYPEALAKSGNTYNHKKLWPLVKPKGCNKPFDYYPRGRVVFTNKGEIIIYMSPDIDEKHITEIKSAFNIQDNPIIRYDFSEHYKCHLDR